MTARTLKIVLVAAAAVGVIAFLLATSLSGMSSGGTHTMPDGSVMQQDEMEERQGSADR